MTGDRIRNLACTGVPTPSNAKLRLMKRADVKSTNILWLRIKYASLILLSTPENDQADLCSLTSFLQACKGTSLTGLCLSLRLCEHELPTMDLNEQVSIEFATTSDTNINSDYTVIFLFMLVGKYKEQIELIILHKIEFSNHEKK